MRADDQKLHILCALLLGYAKPVKYHNLSQNKVRIATGLGRAGNPMAYIYTLDSTYTVHVNMHEFVQNTCR